MTVSDLKPGEELLVNVEETGKTLRLIKMDDLNRFLCQFQVNVYLYSPPGLNASARYSESSLRTYLNKNYETNLEPRHQNDDFFAVKNVLSNYMVPRQVTTCVPPGMIKSVGKKYDITEDFVTAPSLADVEDFPDHPEIKKENPSKYTVEKYYGFVRTPSSPDRFYCVKRPWQKRRKTRSASGYVYVYPIIFLADNTPVSNGFFDENNTNVSKDDFISVLFG